MQYPLLEHRIQHNKHRLDLMQQLPKKGRILSMSTCRLAALAQSARLPAIRTVPAALRLLTSWPKTPQGVQGQRCAQRDLLSQLDVARKTDAPHATVQDRLDTQKPTLDKALRDQAANHGSAPSRLGTELDVKTKATLKMHCDEQKPKHDALLGMLEQYKHNTSQGHNTLWCK